MCACPSAYFQVEEAQYAPPEPKRQHAIPAASADSHAIYGAEGSNAADPLDAGLSEVGMVCCVSPALHSTAPHR
jgi:hypothetical protein